MANHVGLTAIRTLSVLLKAKEKGLVLQLKPLLDEMIEKGRWYSDSVYRYFLTQAGGVIKSGNSSYGFSSYSMYCVGRERSVIRRMMFTHIRRNTAITGYGLKNVGWGEATRTPTSRTLRWGSLSLTPTYATQRTRCHVHSLWRCCFN